jgi:phage repressor protein C with HTH and peptisase S24 domain
MDVQLNRRERLRQFIDDRYAGNVSRFAAFVGKHQSQIADMLIGRKSFGERIARSLEESLGIPAGYLDRASDTDERSESVPEGFVAVRRVRIKMSGGVIGWAVECHEEDAPPLFFRREWFERRGFKPDHLVAVKVTGASMEPGLYDGDTIVVNRADTQLVDGEVFAVSYEGELVIKRLRRDAGEWFLASDNQDKRRYGDKRCTENVVVLGRVVYKNSERI